MLNSLVGPGTLPIKELNNRYVFRLFFTFILSQAQYAQTALYNAGSLHMHNGGNLGFHTHFINASPFEHNQGLAGFYGEAPLLISGTLIPSFQDMELLNPGGLDLRIPIEVRNNMNFILGDIRSTENTSATAIRFAASGNYTGASSLAKIRGIAEVQHKQEFTYPVGDSDHLHPLKISTTGNTHKSRCGYYEGLPANYRLRPIAPGNRQTSELEGISQHGYWKLEGAVMVHITLSWKSGNDMSDFARRIENITLVGWSKLNKNWEILGPVKSEGDLFEGKLESGPFIPDNFEAITFGLVGNIPVSKGGGNFLLTPNGDGINDILDIPVAANTLNNHIRIFDRMGLKVYDLSDYKGQFDGKANVNRVFVPTDYTLPEDIYFYLLELGDRGEIYQGFLYLER